MKHHIDRLLDEKLILQYRIGEVQALEELISRWQEKIYWFVHTLVNDETAIWDITQEVWIVVFKTLRNTLVRNFSAWVYSVARNKAIGYLRKQKVINKHEKNEEYILEQCVENFSTTLIEKEDIQEIRECLQQLSFSQREALLLFYLDDLSLKEIAHVTQVSMGTIQSRLYYGRKKLKELLLKRENYGR